MLTYDQHSIITSAIATMAGERCNYFGEFISWPALKFMPCKVSNKQQMTTWVPKRHVLCRLTKIQDGSTLIEIGGTWFFANQNFAFKSCCPCGFVLMATYTEDIDSSCTPPRLVPRLLAFDVAGTVHGGHDQELFNISNKESIERYQFLRNHAFERYLSSGNGCVVLQWVGYLESAHKIYNQNVGHEIGHLICLTDKAGKMLKPLTVEIPQTQIMLNLSGNKRKAMDEIQQENTDKTSSSKL